METPAFSMDIGLTLGVAGVALALFVWGRWKIEVVGVLVMLAVAVLGLVEPEDAISGFANEATVTVALVLGLSAGLLKTGAVDALGRVIQRLAGTSEVRLTLVILALVAPVSAFINNTAAVAVLLPMVMGLARNAGVAPSRLLMPLSFGSQLGGTLTLIGTSTNLLVAGMVLDLGVERIQLFDITPPALVLAAVGLVYLATVGRWITPHREGEHETLTSRDLREYLSELEVEPGSGLVGRRLQETDLEEEYGVRLVAVRRGDELLYPHEDDDAEALEGDGGSGEDGDGSEPYRFRTGDHLLVRGKLHNLTAVERMDELSLVVPASELEAAERTGAPEGVEDDLRLAEMIVPPRSRVVGSALGDLGMDLPGGVAVLAMERHGEAVERPLPRVELAAGDILLVRAPVERLQALHESGDFGLLGVVELPPKRTQKMKLAVPILLAVVLLAATGVTTILVSALGGMVALVLTGCVRPREVYEEMDWGVVILLGSLLALGDAMQATGTTAFLAGHLVDRVRDLGPHGVLAAFYLLTTGLTALISNNAAALVLTPVAVATAQGLEISPLPLVVAVMFASSNSFVTPIGYQTNTFIYGPGGYRFSDFARVGGPLVLLVAAAATFAIPWFFPF